MIPGITSLQALAAAPPASRSTRVGGPVHVTTGRRLRAEGMPAADSVAVMLDGEGAFRDARRGRSPSTGGRTSACRTRSCWPGRLGGRARRASPRRATRARREKGWIMDIYLLRREPRCDDTDARRRPALRRRAWSRRCAGARPRSRATGGCRRAPTVELLAISENATFLARDPERAAPVVLRVHRPGYHRRAEIESELAWIEALRRDRVVETPEPLAQPRRRAPRRLRARRRAPARRRLRLHARPRARARRRRSPRASPRSARSAPGCTRTPAPGRARRASCARSGTSRPRSAPGRTGATGARRRA